ncbi:DUF998 domain-containing protein [Nonomuraea sp. NPDC050394]|uniref:DUF998 domain-containing protein n=1 Tax=Nonomuraea sp. NPDC050394 TaxID=3364363 RepID=UPI0037B39DB3
MVVKAHGLLAVTQGGLVPSIPAPLDPAPRAGLQHVVNRTRRITMKTSKSLLVGGALAGPFFTVAWLAGGALTGRYDPLRHHISMLVLGEVGWLQTASFLVCGLLIVGFSIGLRRSVKALWGPLLIALSGVGLVGAGAFATDPANGFPPGSPPLPLEPTTSGTLHNLFAALFIFGVPLAAAGFAWTFAKLTQRAWMLYSALSCAAVFVLFLAGPTVFGGAGLFGLQQRIGITLALVWLTALAVHTLITPPTSRREPRT